MARAVSRANNDTLDHHRPLTDLTGFADKSMNDTLVLNLALEEGPSTRREPTKKGGRWTERCVVGYPSMTCRTHGV